MSRFHAVVLAVAASLVTVDSVSAAVAIDATVSRDVSTANPSVTTPAFSTTAGNALLLAFISADSAVGTSTSVTSVTGAGLTWVRVIGTNVQPGTAEIWRAFAASPLTNATVTAVLSQSVASSMTVISFTGVDTSGTNGSGAIGATGSGNAPIGAPTASLVTTRNNSWVFGVGTDWDNPIVRTPGANQTLVHEYFPSVGDTYWVQRQNNPTPLSGTTVTINDTAPTTDRYNLSICEILPAPVVSTWTLSGTISPASAGSGATLVLSGASSATTTADSSGNYTFTGVVNGSYTVGPTKVGYQFTPSSRSVTVSGAAVSGIDFTAQPATYSIDGAISPASIGGGATVTLGGAASATATADLSGHYTFINVASGSYTVTPSRSGYAFTPPSRSVLVSNSPVSGIDFTGQSTTGSISGTISPASIGSGATVGVSGPMGATVTADAAGNYTVTSLVEGLYTVSATKTGYNFTPASQSVTVTGGPVSGINFTAQAITGGISGTISPASLGSGATVTLGGMLISTTADSSGNYTFSGVPDGQINVTPSKLGYAFTPSQQVVTVSGAPVTSVNFTIQATPRWTVSGTISPAFGGSGATVSLNNPAIPSVTADSSGNYTFVDVPDASYTVTATKTDTTFTPASQNVTVNGAHVSGVNFIAQSLKAPISGTISPPSDGAGTLITVGETAQAIADSNGNYTLSSMSNGTYTLTPSKSGYTFTPPSQSVTVNGAPVTDVNFTVTSTTGPATVGQWGAPFDIGLVAVNMVLLHTGKVLMFSGSFAVSATERVWDPATGATKLVPNPYYNLFCAGHSQLADGRILLVGGYAPPSLGAANANIFDPVTETWSALPNMAYRRWYPTSTTLPDGRALVTSGAQSCLTCLADVPEIFDPATGRFTTMPTARLGVPYYPFMYVLPDGKVIDAGSNEDPAATTKLDVTAGTWTTVDPIVRDGHSSAMYLPGKILKTGTATDSGVTGNAASTAYVLDATQPSSAWRQVASMAYPRAYHNTTLLPDGTVLVTGGGTALDGYDVSKAVKAAELWSASTETWQTLSSAAIPRLYHSTALLLPDGRVLTAGSGNDGPAINQLQAELYSPPYLFKGPRPVITSAPGSIAYGQAFAVSTPDAASIRSVSLIRPGAVTHSFDEDQRFLSLGFTAGVGSLSIQAPANANLAPPGYYMLFLVNTAGVPSVAAFVRFAAPSADTEPPTPPSNLAGLGGIGSASLTWTASTDNTGVALYNIHRSTTSGFQPLLANRIAQSTSTSAVDSGVPAGTYFYIVTAQDVAGNVSSRSNEASVIVLADTIAPTVTIMTPAPQSTVSGSISVTATASDDVAVVGVQFKIDGQVLGAERTSPPYSVPWDTTSAANGSHTVSAVARDAAGNRSQADVDVIVSNTSQAPGGLVAAYGFNQGSGVQVVDASGQGNTGTISSATWTATGKFGSALSFNGTSAWVTVAGAASLGLTAGMTLEAWVFPTSGTGWRTVFLKEDAGGLAYALYAANGASRPAGYVHVAVDEGLNGTSAVLLNTWTHLAMTFDGATMRLFVNGVQVSSRALAGSAIVTSGPLRIGGNAVWGEYFRGRIDEVRIYNRALTAAEIQTDMTTPIP